MWKTTATSYYIEKNTYKPHILLLALCKYEDSIRDKRREALETRRKHHKCHVRFKDVFKFFTSKDF